MKKLIIKAVNKEAVSSKETLQQGRLAVVNSQASTKYQVMDETTGLPAKGQVLKKKGKDLVVTVDGEEVAVVHDFYADAPAGEAPTYQVSEASGAAGEGASASGESTVSGDSGVVTGGSSSGVSDGIVWNSGTDGSFQVASAADALGADEGLTTTEMAGLGLGALAAGGGATAAVVAGGGAAAAAATGGAAVVTTVAGSFVAGPVLTGEGLKIEIYNADGTKLLGSGVVKPNGTFSVDVGDYTGIVIAKLIDTNGDTADYMDEATNTGKDVNAEFMAVGAVTSGGALTLNINALTTVAAVKAGVNGPAALSEEAVNSANSDVASAFGLGSLSDLVEAVITTNGDPNADANLYGKILAAFSGADKNNGGDAQSTIDAIAADLGSGSALTNVGKALLFSGAGVIDPDPNRGVLADLIGSFGVAWQADTFEISNDTGAAGDFLTNQASQTLSGTLRAPRADGERVMVKLNSRDWVEATVDGTTWSLAGQTLVDGNNIVQAKVVDANDNFVTSATQIVTLDTSTPTVTVDTVAISVDTGNSDDDLIATQIAEQTLSGTLSAALELGDRVLVKLNGGNWEAATVSGTAWSLASQTLVDGANTVEVKVVDAADNESTAQSQTVTLDTTNPTQTTTVAISADTGTAGDFLTKTAAQTISGTLNAALDLGDRVLVKLNGGNWEAATVSGTAWSLAGKLLSEGANTIEVKVVDAAGNESTAQSQTVTLDRTAPTQTTTVAISDDTDTAGDFITGTASQTISGTLSAALATDERVLVSVNGLDWVEAAVVGGTSEAPTWSLNQTLVTGENQFIKVKVVDAAGNEGDELSQSYTLTDTVAPTVQSVAITNADGLQNSRLNAGDVVRITVTMSETVTVTGSPNLDLNIGGTIVQAAYDSGSSTADTLIFTYTIQAETDTDGISINANSLSLNGGTIMDAANNNAALSHFGASDNASYLVDTTAPSGTLTTAELFNTGSATVQSSEVGIAYLVSDTVTVTDLASITSEAGTKWNSVAITAANTETNLSLAGLSGGTYKLYTVDQAGNLSGESSNTVTVLPSTIDLGTVSGVRLNLIAGTSVNGKIYYHLDANGDGAAGSGDAITHDLLDTLLNAGSDTVDTQTSGAVKGVDDARTVIVNGYTLVLPTLTELHAIYTAVDAANGAISGGVPSGWNGDDYWSATQDSSGYHWSENLYIGFQYPFNDTTYNSVAFQVL